MILEQAEGMAKRNHVATVSQCNFQNPEVIGAAMG
jgi:hypothetical protein